MASDEWGTGNWNENPDASRSRSSGTAGKDYSGAAGSAFGQIAPRIISIGDDSRGGFSRKQSNQIKSNTTSKPSTGAFVIETNGAPISDEEMAAINQGYQDNSGAIGAPGLTGTGQAPVVPAPFVPANSRINVNYNRANINEIAEPNTQLKNIPKDIGLNDSDARASQAKLLALLEQASAGNGPSAAQAQLQAGNEANIKAAMAQSASAKGPSQTASARQAIASSATANQQTANQAALLRAQEMQSAYELNGKVADSIRNTDVSIQTANMGKNLQAAVEQGKISSDEAKTVYTEKVAVEKENAVNDLKAQIANAADATQRAGLEVELQKVELQAKAAKDVAEIQAAASRNTARVAGRTKPTDILTGAASVLIGGKALKGMFGKGDDPDKIDPGVSGSEGVAWESDTPLGPDMATPANPQSGEAAGTGAYLTSPNQQARPPQSPARVQPPVRYGAADVRTDPNARLAMLQRMGLA